MSISPPIRRLSTTSSGSKREEDLINAYEAEEERIINVLSRKLEKARTIPGDLQEEKIELENVLEAESESHVNRLSRELSALRLAQHLATQQGTNVNGVNGTGANGESPRVSTMVSLSDPLTPSTDIMLEAMRRENEQMRNRLVDTEREFIRISRLNEIYREELIEHRRRLGLPVDNLIGLSSSNYDPFSQPTHRRSTSNVSSPSPSVALSPLPSHIARPSPSVPIPRPPSQIHRPTNNTSESNTPLSHSPASSSESPYLSPTTAATNMTTPPSSTSIPLTMHPMSARAPLSYPSVPPPSLSSSFGSPVAYHMQHPSHGAPPHEQLSSSPVEAHTNRWGVPRRGSFERRASLMSGRSSSSRRESVERGARIAETGQLVPRSRTNSVAAGAEQPPPADPDKPAENPT
ncbi:hypothetical protein BV25DRAFT_1872699 [Artomyces pyxidatus]|uniref:Uncharacterized protein n=1 Tax=Artomyces pyxidatus TaxID=48021 RepID=A0ACB8SKZ4_9AGAM|nr:hypothetical protein BV25DRAFT_1872699 [Artomyces pyxidatus]